MTRAGIERSAFVKKRFVVLGIAKSILLTIRHRAERSIQIRRGAQAWKPFGLTVRCRLGVSGFAARVCLRGVDTILASDLTVHRM
jgi:hypothetical protein